MSSFVSFSFSEGGGFGTVVGDTMVVATPSPDVGSSVGVMEPSPFTTTSVFATTSPSPPGPSPTPTPTDPPPPDSELASASGKDDRYIWWIVFGLLCLLGLLLGALLYRAWRRRRKARRQAEVMRGLPMPIGTARSRARGQRSGGGSGPVRLNSDLTQGTEMRSNEPSSVPLMHGQVGSVSAPAPSLKAPRPRHSSGPAILLLDNDDDERTTDAGHSHTPPASPNDLLRRSLAPLHTGNGDHRPTSSATAFLNDTDPFASTSDLSTSCTERGSHGTALVHDPALAPLRATTTRESVRSDSASEYSVLSATTSMRHHLEAELERREGEDSGQVEGQGVARQSSVARMLCERGNRTAKQLNRVSTIESRMGRSSQGVGL
ncbi:hypothetical protein BDV98DRAFT_574008 [Pterulicium gracile]|uniref:Uncharacterized protein n=1 Tax=Pterulicium gracile TaxID=1884261 RepID=A0A5C3QB97_9AGAR|nr:hypothetical protein BDV98DRAFT_574008 [Pterula gracilis]